MAIYGRVSTEHEAQLAAFENQQAWYEGIAKQHSDWIIVERYYDEGITGTAAQKRPAFMSMLEAARHGTFDLIVTREVCRFARNTVDTLTVTRELKKLNVEVYFVQDNIWTMDGDGELRLTIMATLAQEESRKISERVLAGQQVSREKGRLYGNGNILGYDLVSGTYQINPDQAYVVQKIFQLYSEGWGYKRICGELLRLGCKNAHGEVSWKVDGIGRIIRNATYKGYICYNKSHSDGYLTQKRVYHREEEFVYIKGDFEPIVSEELWQKCSDIRRKRSTRCVGPDGKMQKYGRKEPQSVWCTKLRCSCGSAFRKFLWHINEDGKKSYGYECYRQKRTASAQYLISHGLDPSLICQSKSIPYWHIDLMARDVFRMVWRDRKDAVLLTYQMLEECATKDSETYTNALSSKEAQMEKLQKSLERLRRMCAMGDITREEFLSDSAAIRSDISTLELQIKDLRTTADQQSAAFSLDFARIRETLDRWIDFSGPTISDALIDQFILQVVLIDDDTFNWTLDLSSDKGEEQPTASQIALDLYRQQKSSSSGVPMDSMLSNHITDPHELFSFTISADEAAAYCKSIGMKFFRKKWHDKKVIVSI
ncbi:recombinase family protein [Flavonifractor sp. An92]|uniref:recombinase family protein n=1 Tax=Flavonifractor sp. An92 TaxID=1965666 RepID=UPI0013025454|nr:recombinase family protein [Flavonifractor sp. An92]